MKKFMAACLFPIVLTIAAAADTIYFKDGMKTICQEKAWEENDQVKCEYDGWIISYQKTDVLRIVKSKSSPGSDQPIIKKKVSGQTEPAGDAASRIIPEITTENTFYNPRRPHKYWTDQNSKHKSYKDAIKALSLKYDRSPEWIQQNMGHTNNLTEIHQNLRTKKSAESSK